MKKSQFLRKVKDLPEFARCRYIRYIAYRAVPSAYTWMFLDEIVVN